MLSIRKAGAAVITALVMAAGIAVAPAQAAPVASVPRSESILPGPINGQANGDGVSAPSHEESTRVIPLCEGPIAVAQWLNVNFSDHGRDIQRYISLNGPLLSSLDKFANNPILGPVLLAQAILTIPTYAINDALFHLPATALRVLTGCGVLTGNSFNSRA